MSRDVELDRLLRAAAPSTHAPAEMPFGFDTRVIALWRSRRNGNGFAFGRILQRIALTAAAVTVAAGVAAWWQASSPNEPFAAAYAIADTAIETGALQ